jgi:hypothetical protein
MAVDANLKCTSFRCAMQLSHCVTKCGFSGRNGKQCPDLATFAFAEPSTTIAVVAAAAQNAYGNPITAAFKESFPALLPGGVAREPPKPKPSERLPVSIASLPQSTNFTSILIGGSTPAPAEKPPDKSPEKLPDKPPEKPIKKTPVTDDSKDKPMSPAATPANPPATQATDREGEAESSRRAAPENKPPIVRRKKVMPNISGMNFFLESEQGSNLFVLLPVNNSNDAIQALSDNPHRRLILATGVTYEFKVDNLKLDPNTP